MAKWPASKHNYSKEAAYQARPEQKKARARRNADRREAQARGLVHKGDAREVDHEHTMGRGGYRVISRHANRVKANRSAARR